MTEKEIEIVMNALVGIPIVTTAEFAQKVEKILREYKECDDNEQIHTTFNQFGGAYQIYFKDYIDVSEKKSVYIRAVRSSDTIESPFNGQYACYDSEKNIFLEIWLPRHK